MKAALAAWVAVAASTSAEMPAVAQERAMGQVEMGRAHVDWSRDAVIYQINTRQFTPEGTLAAAEAELDRLAALGVDILWLMPIHPIGEKNRKGTLGSPYAIIDYNAVRAELGSLADLKSFIEAAHLRDMKVILDWVANHTAWDHPWASDHPDWYARDWKGDFVSTPYWDWTDIIDLDYSQPGLRAAMLDAMRFWVEEADVDGYRADVAGYVPLDFWEEARRQLEAIKPVWMLAEYPQRDVHQFAFDATYAWDWQKPLREIGAGEADATALYGFYSEHASMWPKGAQRMIFTSNHDQNSWEGTARERLGPALENAFVLMFTSEGIPLIYNGQEAGLDKRLEFFERDPIDWRKHENFNKFRGWIAFRDAHPALHNAPWGGEMVHVKNSDEAKVFSFVRARDGDAVFVAQNYSDMAVTVTLGDMPFAGQWSAVDSAMFITPCTRVYREDCGVPGFAMKPPQIIETGTELALAPWSSMVFAKVEDD